MKLLVLGATGRTGGEIVDVALARGHAVTAFVRSPHKIQRRHSALSVERGSPLDPDGLSEALRGHDAVLSALGLPAREALRPSTFMTECATSTVGAMERAGVERLAIVSAAVLFPGSGPAYQFFRWLLTHHARDLSAMEAVVRATELDWTIARPPRLFRSAREGYKSSAGVLPEGSYSVSFRALARFLVDCIEARTHGRQTVGVTG
jgi:putative NADH-flavin reductase